MDCAICLNHIERQQEAYLYPCCHFFCFKCIREWTDRQRQHGPDEQCQPAQRCTFACPLCKQAYTYVVYECIGSSCRLLPTCGQPKTMSAMPLSVEQSRRRALYVTPSQLAQAKQVPVARRPRPPQDKEAVRFMQRELQAVLLTEDVDVIVQHLTGVLVNITKKQPPKTSQPSTFTFSATYGDKVAFSATVSKSMAGFLDEQHSARLAEELWLFLQSGLTLFAYDRLIFGDDPSESARESPIPGVTQFDGLTEGGQDW